MASAVYSDRDAWDLDDATDHVPSCCDRRPTLRRRLSGGSSSSEDDRRPDIRLDQLLWVFLRHDVGEVGSGAVHRDHVVGVHLGHQCVDDRLGNLRIVGHGRLCGGELVWRNADGLDEGTPLYIARRGENPAVPVAGQRELRIVIGPDAQTDNRLVIGPERPPAAPAGASRSFVACPTASPTRPRESRAISA
jgi:hypothetical protein